MIFALQPVFRDDDGRTSVNLLDPFCLCTHQLSFSFGLLDKVFEAGEFCVNIRSISSANQHSTDVTALHGLGLEVSIFWQ